MTTSSSKVTLVVLAKAPIPGRSKTRLCPPCVPHEAAAMAEAALADTLEAGSSTSAARRVLVLSGPPGPWLPPGWEVVPQRGRGLDERLEAAFCDVGAPALLVGMDTPQLAPELLNRCMARLYDDHVDAVLGPASDGGFWAVGLRRPCAGAFCGVQMSTSATGAMQRARLVTAGLRVAMLPMLRDVDCIDDAVAVAVQAPATRFARQVHALQDRPSVTGEPASGINGVDGLNGVDSVNGVWHDLSPFR
ncbi:MAG: TIGR04282 family arsenosugar biosynthesis glycosyltransferase [Acidimicrobiales bacterium]